ncbi:MAG: putative bifunctional diguanylate cyclase/phosphodiesterase [Lysobacter sp.]
MQHAPLPRFADHAGAPWSGIGNDLPSDIALSGEEFADVVSLATQLLDAPIVVLSLGHGDDSRLIAQHGLGLATATENALLRATGTELPRLLLADARADDRFRDDPIVAGEPGVRFFVALAITGADGHCIGTLGIADTVARAGLAGDGEQVLARLARLAARLLERRQLQRRNRIAAQIMQADFSAVVVVDGSDSVVFVNRAAEALFGGRARGMRGMPIQALFAAHLQPDPAAAEAWLRGEAWLNDEVGPFNLHVQGRGEELRTLEAARCAWPLNQGQGVALVLRDITQRLAQQEHLHRIAMVDALTGLPNRNALIEVLDTHLQSGMRSLGLVLLGLDNFKAINDTLGHANGDAALQAVAERLHTMVPKGTALARCGGDEFAIVYPDVDGDALEQRLTRLFADDRPPFEVNGHRIHLDASIGLAVFTHGDDDGAVIAGNDLVARADLALYKAKANGGRRYCRFELGMRREINARRMLDLELRRAHVQGEFELHYQPQIDLASGTTVGAEALLRWRHPQRGLLLPVDFIEALGASPVAADVGRWILRQACHDAARWPRVDGREVAISINLFPVQVTNGRLQEEVDQALAASGLEPSRLELEITENIALRPGDLASRSLGTLRERGVRLAFDDFGTGYASLSMLQRFRIDRVKIDRSFVRDMLANHGDAAIVRSIMLISRNLELEVIAEGVENLDQAELLHTLGCQGAQGFLYAPALAASAFDAWLASEPRAIPVAAREYPHD